MQVKQVDLAQAKRTLALVWFIGASVVVSLVVVQSLLGKFGDRVMDARQPKRATTFADLIGTWACWRNLGRKSLAAETQAIVITHNRGTIEVADTLYGVSMREDGVSQVLSLRLADAVVAG